MYGLCNWEINLETSPLKINIEPLKFLKKIQGDICGLIQPISELFRHFMV
jgi:hypothetical protein